MHISIDNRIIIFSALILTCCAACVDDRADFIAKNKIPDQSFVENFETQQRAFDSGWHFINRSIQEGPSNWTTPDNPPFFAYSSQSTRNAFLWVDYLSTSSGIGTISNWSVSPAITFQNGDKIIFYARAELVANGTDSTDFANRLQLNINTANESLNVGNGSAMGDFTLTLVDINPTYISFSLAKYNSPDPAERASMKGAFPHRWNRFEAVISGLLKPVKGRFAFRYYLESGGFNGRGTSVGIDSVAYVGKK